jgi:hypothetical protein
MEYQDKDYNGWNILDKGFEGWNIFKTVITDGI